MQCAQTPTQIHRRQRWVNIPRSKKGAHKHNETPKRPTQITRRMEYAQRPTQIHRRQARYLITDEDIT